MANDLEARSINEVRALAMDAVQRANSGHPGTPMALAPLIIRLGADASSEVLRRCARCTICGHKGATLKHPGWKNGEVEQEPFPTDMMTP